jgi:hypothetical protein
MEKHPDDMKILRHILMIIILLPAIAFAAGCAESPASVARYYISSVIKGNNENARMLVVADQQKDYAGTSGGAGEAIAKIIGLDKPNPRTDAIARVIAASIVIEEKERTEKKVIIKYTFDTDKIRKEFEKKDISSNTLVEAGIREDFINHLRDFSAILVLVPEDGKWRVDLKASK